jgi:hypothetical protein
MHAARFAPALLALACAGKEPTDPDIEVHEGDLPIILSAPHGGHLTPDEIPDRTTGRNGRDVGTRELTLELADALEDLTGQRPIVVINNLHRKKLDANREIVEAAEGDPRAEAAWQAYHSAIEEARAEVVDRHEAGLFLDVHGHDHPNDWLELGYLLDNDDLDASDAELDGATYADGTSVAELVDRSGRPLSAIVRGAVSFGALMEDRGYPSVPSPETPSPGEEAFYNGGHNTERYGSLDGGTVSGFQLEYAGVMREPAGAREQTAADTAGALVAWMRALYGEASIPE